MNTIERALSDDLVRLMDRLATSIPEGAVEQVRTTTPRLRARLDEMEANLTAARAALLEAHGRWGRALDDLENLWALAAWRAAAEEPDQTLHRRAA